MTQTIETVDLDTGVTMEVPVAEHKVVKNDALEWLDNLNKHIVMYGSAPRDSIFDLYTYHFDTIRNALESQLKWHPIDHTRPEDYCETGIFAVKLSDDSTSYYLGYCDYIEEGMPMRSHEYGDYDAPYNFDDYTHYLKLSPPKGDK